MTAIDPGLTAPRALRTSVALTLLAAPLLVCSAAVVVAGSLQSSSVSGGGSAPRPMTTAQPARSGVAAPVTALPSCLRVPFPPTCSDDGSPAHHP